MFIFLKKHPFFILLAVFSSQLFADAQDDAIAQTNQFSKVYLDFKESTLDKLEFGKLTLPEKVGLLKAYDKDKRATFEEAVASIKKQWDPELNDVDSNIDAVINPASDHSLPRSYISLRTTIVNIQNGFELIDELRASIAQKLVEDIKQDSLITSKRDGFGFHELQPEKYAGQLNDISSVINDTSLIEEAIEDYQTSVQMLEDKRQENIKNARFPQGHVEISNGDADELADSIKQWLQESPGWGRKAKDPYTILTVAITRDWAIMKRSITGDAIQYGLPIKVALQTKDDKNNGLARVFNLTILTQIVNGVSHAPPWTNAAVGTSQFILVDNIGNGVSSGASSSSGAMGTLLWLALSLLAVLSGFVASKSFLDNKHQFLTQSYQRLSSLSTTIGLAALAVAIASFAYSTLSLNILAGIIPQLLVFITGLLLAEELVMKKLQERPEGDVANLATAQQENLNKLSLYQGTLGLTTLVTGFVYLVSAGALYII